MSRRSEPMWHCYECNAEMRPMMTPDPHCASCNSTFVEMIENEADDPRRFQAPGHIPGDDEYDGDLPHFGLGGGGGGIPPDATMDAFRAILSGLGGPQHRAPATIRIDRRTTANGGPSTHISYGGGGGGPMMMGNVPPEGGFFYHTTFGGGSSTGTRQAGGESDIAPLLAALLGGMPRQGGPGGQATTEGAGAFNPLRSFFRALGLQTEGMENGQLGDYALSNEALDRIVSQLMEQSNGDKPVPAPDDMIASLPRIKVAAGSDLLEKDCAVCKDDFEVAQETIQLPCKHHFHDECILPWIKQSGTCPVCRHELVPQPKHAPGGAGNPGAGAGPSSGGGASAGGAPGGGLFSFLRGGSSGSSNTSQQSGSPNNHLPGAWDLD
ncbi:hypothetical protein DL93DRAFT_635845 [Clavulina sp. PMI_390]|nr:hypothetical protein DL93DRAFT_635845 [Clavulina sp. PMI_390]